MISKARAEPRAAGESSTIMFVMNIQTNWRRWCLMRGRKKTEQIAKARVQKTSQTCHMARRT